MMGISDSTIQNVGANQARSRFFVQGAFRRFFIPAMVSTFWLVMAGVVDSVFVGRGIGTDGLATIGFGQPIYLFYNILSYGFSIGGSIHYASKLAEGREYEGNRIFHTILRLLLSVYIVTVILGIVFLPQLASLLGADPSDTLTQSYIRTQLMFVPINFLQGPFYYFVNADNGPKRAAFAMSMSGILDAIFSYIFIIRMGLGVRGSVYSTVVGAVVMLCITGAHIAKKRGALRFRLVGADARYIALSARTGFATSLQYLYQFITMIAVNRLLMRHGGSVAVAAFDVVYNISLLCASISDATIIATEPMLSSYRSERNLGNIRETLRLAITRPIGLSVLFAAVLAFFAPWFATLFGMAEGTAHTYASMGIRVFALSVLPAFVNAVFAGYYQAILREHYTYFITFLRSFVFYLLAVLLFASHGMNVFWFVFLVAEVLTMLLWVPITWRRGGLLQLKGIDTSRTKTAMVDKNAQSVSDVVAEIQTFCEEQDVDMRKSMHIGLVIEEVCMAIVNRYKDEMEDIYVQVTTVVEDEETTLFLRDNAFAYNPLGIDTDEIVFSLGENEELMGVRIVQKAAKEFYYRRYSGFNTLVIRL